MTDQQPTHLAEAQDWIRRHHVHKSLTRSLDGHPMCEEDEMPMPCPAAVLLTEVERLTIDLYTLRAEAATVVNRLLRA